MWENIFICIAWRSSGQCFYQRVLRIACCCWMCYREPEGNVRLSWIVPWVPAATCPLTQHSLSWLGLRAAAHPHALYVALQLHVHASKPFWEVCASQYLLWLLLFGPPVWGFSLSASGHAGELRENRECFIWQGISYSWSTLSYVCSLCWSLSTASFQNARRFSRQKYFWVFIYMSVYSSLAPHKHFHLQKLAILNICQQQTQQAPNTNTAQVHVSSPWELRKRCLLCLACSACQ